METVMLTLGGKKYLATQLTRAEFRAFARIDTALRAASAAAALPTLVTLTDELAEIICASIRRGGSLVSPDEAELWPMNDLVKASGSLLNFIDHERFDRERLDGPSSGDEFPGSSKIQ